MNTCAILHPLSSILWDAHGPILSYIPFLNPLPIWHYWYLLLIPLSAAVAIVYKSLKVPNMRDVPWQSFVITLWILVGMSAGAAGLALIVWIVEWMRNS